MFIIPSTFLRIGENLIPYSVHINRYFPCSSNHLKLFRRFFEIVRILIYTSILLNRITWMPFQCEFAISLLDDINPNNQLLRTLYSTLHLVPLPRFHSNPSWGDWTWQQRLFCSSFRWILFVVDLFIFYGEFRRFKEF